MSLTSVTNMNRMKKLQEHAGTTDFDFVTDYVKTVKLINDNYNNLNSRKSYLSSVMAYLRDNTTETELLKRYNVYHKILRGKIEAEMANNIKDDDFIEWADLIEYRDDLKEKATNKTSHLKYMIIALYTYNPPLRADWGRIRIVKRDIKTDDNILVWNKNPKFIINSYKTAKTAGPITIPVDGELRSIIKDHIEKYVSGNFLINMSDNAFVKMVKRILHDHFQHGSINSIRKSFVSHVFENFGDYTNKEIEKISHMMGHSVGMAISNYRKVDKK